MRSSIEDDADRLNALISTFEPRAGICSNIGKYKFHAYTHANTSSRNELVLPEDGDSRLHLVNLKEWNTIDKMIVKEMRFYGYHGVFPEENKLGQQYYVDLELSMDLERASQTDDLNYTVNYAELHAFTKAIVEGPPFKLIEALAGCIASRVLEVYTIVNEVTVRVTKPHPPFDIHFDGVTVELRRGRDTDGRPNIESYTN